MCSSFVDEGKTTPPPGERQEIILPMFAKDELGRDGVISNVCICRQSVVLLLEYEPESRRVNVGKTTKEKTCQLVCEMSTLITGASIVFMTRRVEKLHIFEVIPCFCRRPQQLRHTSNASLT